MKTLYIECSMGAAGDMLASALLELTDNADLFVKRLNSANIPDVRFIREDSVKCGIKGTHIKVLVDGKQEHNHEHPYSHHHRSMKDIMEIVDALNVSQNVKNNVASVYNIIAQAESEVHGSTVTDIHFHEVGTLDAIADITAVCMLIEELCPDSIAASAVNTGSGTVNCAHGVLPVPAPATALILKDIPSYSNDIRSELCTPTGAAILKHFCCEFGNRPAMKIQKIGYGMGNKDFETANCVRAFLGQTEEKAPQITELSFNVDDMTGEEIGFLTQTLFDVGAREVFTVPVMMKKSRPGELICVLCDEENKEKILSVIFKNSTTIGVREDIKNRYTLERKLETIVTPYGEVRKKISFGYGAEKSKFEYDDLERIAKENSISVFEARKAAEKADK